MATYQNHDDGEGGGAFRVWASKQMNMVGLLCQTLLLWMTKFFHYVSIIDIRTKVLAIVEPLFCDLLISSSFYRCYMGNIYLSTCMIRADSSLELIWP